MEHIKSAIERLYKTDPNIHISVKLTHPRIVIENIPARIVGVYKNIFQIEKSDGEHLCRHTFQYCDVLTGHVAIAELS
ncbi:MAG: hypothetical protein E7617_01415 [Ruminococcaceae bacterium]|nr:hypothetical protein [Oscillospiraceae bacterium]